MAIQNCHNCGQIIGNLQEPFSFQGNVVCKACKILLENESQTTGIIESKIETEIPITEILPQDSVDTKHKSTADLIQQDKQVRPWVRYWARMLDIFLFSFLAGIALAFIYAPALKMPNALLSIVLLFAYVFVEPAMLAGWGTTPGKALLRVRLRSSNGSKLSYVDALSRAFKVWFRGVGLGIPIVALFTQIHAYNRLTEQGITSWDEEGNCTVSHQVVGAWRIIVTVLIFIAFFFLMVLGNADL